MPCIKIGDKNEQLLSRDLPFLPRLVRREGRALAVRGEAGRESSLTCFVDVFWWLRPCESVLGGSPCCLGSEDGEVIQNRARESCEKGREEDGVSSNSHCDLKSVFSGHSLQTDV